MPVSYKKTFDLMKERNISYYYLVKSPKNPLKIGKETYKGMEEGKHVNTITLEKLCRTFDCQIGDLIEYVPDPETEKSGKD